MNNNTNSHNPLGKKVSHPSQYDPDQIYSISREEARRELRLSKDEIFYGEDIWNAYEISWLNENGVPRIAIGTFRVPADSPFIVESKSMKLYLNSFNQSRFASADIVHSHIQEDLSKGTGAEVEVELQLPNNFHKLQTVTPDGICIDDQLEEADTYQVQPDLLSAGDQVVRERLFSRLLRTRCPVTDQPDWATVFIDYSGPAINRSGLLGYLVSYREHNGFHENCVERIFIDIFRHCRPEMLRVEARFTRRGGIDINPVRANYPTQGDNIRLVNQ